MFHPGCAFERAAFDFFIAGSHHQAVVLILSFEEYGFGYLPHRNTYPLCCLFSGWCRSGFKLQG